MAEEAAPVLMYWERLPPAEVLAAASIAKVAIQPTPDPKASNKDYIMSLKFSDGRVLEGLPMILKYIARAAAPNTPPLYGTSAMDACTIDQWMDFCNSQFVSGPGLQAAVASAGESLALKTFMVGHTLSIADLCGWGKIQTAAMWMKVRNTPDACNVRRWFEFCTQQPPVAAAVEQLAPKKVGKDAKATNTASRSAKSTSKTVDAASLDMALPDAKQGAVVTRFPPEPSGYLHIGHAKAALLNQIFADRYDGKLIVRFDDTNPSKENEEFVGNIIEDMERLGLKYGGVITYASDFFPGMIDIARKMIQAGHMYADNTDVDTMRSERLACTPSKNRDQKPDETLRIFDDEMLKGTTEGKAFCLRVRLDMANANACLRDPVAFRCNEHPHWRCGTKYKCYPTYDFACPYVDSSQGVTHALRTSEYRDREEQFQRIHRLMQQSKPELPPVVIWDYSRLNFVNTVLSKRKLQKLVDTGVVQGWTDPRFPTVQGIIRRGLQVEALREFIMAQGASKNNNLQQWDKIWAINKQVIDPVAPRHTAVAADGKVPVELSNGPRELELLTIPKHKKNPDVGVKTLYRTSSILIDQEDAQSLAQGEEVTLMDWGNCIMHEVVKGADGKVTSIKAQLHLEGDFKKTKLKLTWLAAVEDLVPLRLVALGDLITKAKLEEDDEFDDFVNRDSWHESAALGDPNMRALQHGDVIQLERKGFFKVDEAMTKPGKPLLLISIPDGRQKK